MCMSPIIKMVGFTVAWGWDASFLTTRSDSRLRGLEEESCIEYIELQKHLSKQMKGDVEVENICELQDKPV